MSRTLGPPFMFRWPGHLRNFLEIAYSSNGLRCPEPFIVACCDYILHIANTHGCSYAGMDNTPLKSKAIVRMMGHNPSARMYQVCREILNVSPSSRHTEGESAFAHLELEFERSLGHIKCICKGNKNCQSDLSKGWKTVMERRHQFSRCCIPLKLSHTTGAAIVHGLKCLFVIAFEDAVVESPDPYLKFGPRPYLEKGRCDIWHNCQDLYNDLLGKQVLLGSSGSSSIFPDPLVALRNDPENGYFFRLVDGQIIMKNRYYRSIRSRVSGSSRRATKRLASSNGKAFFPSSSGEPSDLHITVVETAKYLELRTNVIAQGQIKELNLYEVLVASMDLMEGEPCNHPLLAPLEEKHADKVWPTSVIAPDAPMGKISIVHTRHNPTAQLLACSLGNRVILMQHTCCLNCAVEQVKTYWLQVSAKIIVASD